MKILKIKLLKAVLMTCILSTTYQGVFAAQTKNVNIKNSPVKANTIKTVINKTDINLFNNNLKIETAKKLIETTKYEEADNLLSEVVESDPLNITAYNLLGRNSLNLFIKNSVDLRVKENDLATLTSLCEVPKMLDDNERIHFPADIFLAAYERQIQILDRYNQAFDYYNKSLSIDSKNTETLNGIAYLYMRRGEFNKAEQYLNNVLAIDPNNAEAYKNQGLLHKYKSRIWQNRANKFRLAYDVPSIFTIIYNIEDMAGTTYYMASKFSNINASIKNFNKSLELDKNNLDIYIQFAKFYIEKRKYNDAEKILSEAEKRFANNTIVNNTFGDLYLKRRNYKKASEYYQKSLSIDKNNTHSNYMVAKLYDNGKYVKKDKTKAAEYYYSAYTNGYYPLKLKLYRISKKSDFKFNEDMTGIETNAGMYTIKKIGKGFSRGLFTGSPSLRMMSMSVTEADRMLGRSAASFSKLLLTSGESQKIQDRLDQIEKIENPKEKQAELRKISSDNLAKIEEIMIKKDSNQKLVKLNKQEKMLYKNAYSNLNKSIIKDMKALGQTPYVSLDIAGFIMNPILLVGSVGDIKNLIYVTSVMPSQLQKMNTIKQNINSLSKQANITIEEPKIKTDKAKNINDF